MKQIRKSIWFMLTYSIVSITLVIGITIFFMAFQLLISDKQGINLKAILGAITISMTLAVFLGVYFGGALQQLKQNYLWNINKRYRHSLIFAFLISLVVFNLLHIPILYQNLKHMPLVLAMPVCASIFSSYLVLGKNLLYKLLIPAVPIIIVQAYKLNVSFNNIFLMIILATIILVGIMFVSRYKTSDANIKNETQKTMDTISFNATGLSSKVITNLNSFIGDIVAKNIIKKKRNIDWAIIMPHNKLTLFAIMYVLLITFAVLFFLKEGKMMLEAIAVLFLASSMISILMESRLLLRQLRTVAHVFSGENHRQLRNKILNSLDKNFIVNFCVFVLGLIIMAKLFSLPLNVQQLIGSSFVILMVALAYYPLLLCFHWINISLPLVLAVSVYAGSLFISLRWLKQCIDGENLLMYFSILIVSLVLIRFLAQHLFWRHPFEQLLKNK